MATSIGSVSSPTQRELNFAVQRIIDRIIFLRICEDRGIEDYGRLRSLVNGARIYPRVHAHLLSFKDRLRQRQDSRRLYANGPSCLRGTPVRVIDFSSKSDKAAHDRMVTMVERMLEMHRQLAAVRTPQEKTALERQITATDAQIDRLVYDLYGLTEEEIRIVEGAAPPETEPQLEVPGPREPIAARTPRRRRAKGADAEASSAPAKPGINPNNAWADAAHYYGKEELSPYGKEQP